MTVHEYIPDEAAYSVRTCRCGAQMRPATSPRSSEQRFVCEGCRRTRRR